MTRLTPGRLGRTTTNRSRQWKPSSANRLISSTWVSRWRFALTSSWHLTISTPPGRSTRRADVMGALVNRRPTTIAASVVAALIIGLNVFLLYQTLFG